MINYKYERYRNSYLLIVIVVVIVVVVVIAVVAVVVIVVVVVVVIAVVGVIVVVTDGFVLHFLVVVAISNSDQRHFYFIFIN